MKLFIEFYIILSSGIIYYILIDLTEAALMPRLHITLKQKLLWKTALFLAFGFRSDSVLTPH